jgi:hypothetical protein
MSAAFCCIAFAFRVSAILVTAGFVLRDTGPHPGGPVLTPGEPNLQLLSGSRCLVSL